MSMNLSLGGFRLEHHSTQRQADVRISANLSTAQGDLIDFDRDVSILESLSALKIWVARTQHFSLVVQVVAGLASEDICVLTQIIQQAKLWRQLNLEVDAPEICQDPEATSFSFIVRHHESDDKTASRRSHKLTVDESSSDLRPPAVVTALRVNHFLLQLTLSTLCAESDPPAEVHHDDSRTSVDGSGSMLMDDNFEDDCMLDESSDPGLHLAFANTLFAGTLHMATNDSTGFVEADMAPSDPRRTDSSLVPLMDAALRYAITSTPKRLHRGIRLEDDARQATLQDIAPAIWSPGYLAAMTERACFIPTINRALFVALQSRTKFDHFPERYRWLQDPQSYDRTASPSLVTTDSDCGHTAPDGLSDSATLWKKLHQAMSQRARQVSLQRLDVVEEESLLEDEQQGSILQMASHERASNVHVKQNPETIKDPHATELLMWSYVATTEESFLEPADLKDDLADEDFALLFADPAAFVEEPINVAAVDGCTNDTEGDLIQGDEWLIASCQQPTFSQAQENRHDDDDMLSDAIPEILNYEEDGFLSSQSSFTSCGSGEEELLLPQTLQ